MLRQQQQPQQQQAAMVATSQQQQQPWQVQQQQWREQMQQQQQQQMVQQQQQQQQLGPATMSNESLGAMLMRMHQENKARSAQSDAQMQAIQANMEARMKSLEDRIAAGPSAAEAAGVDANVPHEPEKKAAADRSPNPSSS